MGENTEQMQKAMSDLIARIDAMNTRMGDLGKQLEITQESVDEVRKKQAEVAPAVAGAGGPRDPGTSTAAQYLGMPRLTNNGQPILSHPPSGAPGASQNFFTTPNSPSQDQYQEHHVKMPKHDFPKFGGINPRPWLDLCDTYFQMYQVPQYQWVCTAVLYLEGHAALWWHAFRRRCATVDWGAFATAVTVEFGTEEFDTQMAKMLQLRQTGTVMKYRLQFEACMYHLLSLDETLNNKFFVAQFVLGLKDELRTAVRL